MVSVVQCGPGVIRVLRVMAGGGGKGNPCAWVWDWRKSVPAVGHFLNPWRAAIIICSELMCIAASMVYLALEQMPVEMPAGQRGCCCKECIVGIYFLKPNIMFQVVFCGVFCNIFNFF